MGSLFEVPLHLMMLLTLAAADPAVRPTSASEPQAVAGAAQSDDYRLSEQAWLQAVQAGAGGNELADVRGLIFKTSNGRYYVPAEAARKRLQEMRRDPGVAALVTFDLARQNAALLSERLKRPASAGDLYVAHSLGIATAADLIAAAETTPDSAAIAAVPALAHDPALARSAEAKLKIGALYKKLTGAFATPAPDARLAQAGSKERSPYLPPSALRGPAHDDTSGWTAVENVTHVGWAAAVGR